MFIQERHAAILERLETDGKVLVKDLAATFNVTEDSIRKDLAALESDGKLKRTYGGAVTIAEKLQMTEANQRRISYVLAKRKIADVAVTLMQPRDLIFLDVSTISIAIAQLLEKSAAPYNILTNMVDVLVMLARNPNINLFFAGGLINQSRDGFSDSLNLQFISNFRPDVAFIGAFGVDIKKNSLTSRGTDSGVHKARIIEIRKASKVIYACAGTMCTCGTVIASRTHGESQAGRHYNRTKLPRCIISLRGCTTFGVQLLMRRIRFHHQQNPAIRTLYDC